MAKPKLCFFMGYAQLFDHHNKRLAENIYGSELALLHLSNELSTTYDIYITSLNTYEDMDFGNLHYIHHRHLEGMHSRFDILIVWRYLNFFVHYSSEIARKTYLWLHDTYILPWLEGHHLPDIGKPLVHNILHRITSVIVLSEWHKAQIIKTYGIQDSESIAKFHIIGNALEDEHVKMMLQNTNIEVRVRNRFIWVSAHDRGLENLLIHFPKIREQLPDSELHIYRTCAQELQNKYTETFYKYHGFVSNTKIIKHMLQSQFWFYPTDFEETFCISALEAQACGCTCITTPKAALQEMIADRGILLNGDVYTEKFWGNVVSLLKQISETTYPTQDSIIWGRQQTWSKRALEWLSLFGANRTDTVATFYINLSHRNDRQIHCVNNLLRVGVPQHAIFRKEAVDGFKYAFSPTEIDLFKHADFISSENSRAIMGNFLSHMQLWQHVVNEGLEFAVILQDDIVLANNYIYGLRDIIDDLPSNAEIVWLGLPWNVPPSKINDDIHSFELFPSSAISRKGHLAHLHYGINPGSLAYIITQSGAKNIIQYTMTKGVHRATDWHMNDYLASISKHYVARRLIASCDLSFKSDIFNTD